MSDLVPDASITNQKQTGRCWAFAGLNVLRAAMIKELELELPGAEPVLPLLLRQAGEGQRVPDPRHRRGRPPLDDREVVASLYSPVPDGGWWPELARLVTKYGVVPAYAMPDTVSAGDSEAMNEHLATLLRRTALRLRAAVADGVEPEPLRLKALEQVHRMLCIHLGTLPSEFVWQYRDKNKEFHRVGTLTPLEFAQRYVTGVEELVVLAHAMCLTGADLVDGVPRRWQVENSWGDKLGDKGFHTMSDSWFDEYVFEVVVRACRPGDRDDHAAQLGPDGLRPAGPAGRRRRSSGRSSGLLPA